MKSYIKKMLAIMLCAIMLTNTVYVAEATGSTTIVIGSPTEDFEVDVTYKLEDGTAIFVPSFIVVNEAETVTQDDIPDVEQMFNAGYNVISVKILDADEPNTNLPNVIKEGQSLEVVLQEISVESVHIPVTFFDYDVSEVDDFKNASINKYGIGNEGKYLAMGGKTNSTNYSLEVPHNFSLLMSKGNAEYEANIEGVDGDNPRIIPGIIAGLSGEGYKNLDMGTNSKGELIVEPGYFSGESVDGKTIYAGEDVFLDFKQTGSSLQLTSANVNGTITETGQGNIQYFPLNNVSHLGIDPKQFGNNVYFGMRYDFTYSIGDYIGPLTYEFTGDDDLWVFVNGQLVLDLGGIHAEYPGSMQGDDPNSVDLWDVTHGISAQDRQTDGWWNVLSEGEKTKENIVTVLYMERGAYESNCSMDITIPNFGTQEIVVGSSEIDISFTKVDSGNGNILEGAGFKLTKNTDGYEEQSTVSDENGIVIFEDLTLGEYTLTEVYAPFGYELSKNTWTISVTKKDDYGNLKYTITGDGASGNMPSHTIGNTQFDEFMRIEQTKTSTLTNWVDRTYEIDINVKGYFDDARPSYSETMLVLDASGSMDNSASSDGTTRWELLEDATTGFINARDESSLIGAVRFYQDGSWFPRYRAQVLSPLTKNNEQIIAAIDKVEPNGGTDPSLGLNLAYEQFSDEKTSKNIVLFADGDVDSRNIANEVTKSVKYARENNINIYVVYFGDENEVPENYKGWTAGNGKAYMANNAEDLEKIFEEISNEISVNIEVVDVIDPRFEIIGDIEVVKAQLGAESIEVTDQGTKIIWHLSNEDVDVNDTNQNGWETTIEVRAKDDFFGGNNIETNTNDSQVTVGVNEPIKLGMPTVNVKTRFDAFNANDIIFKGETLGEHLMVENTDGITSSLFDVNNIKYGDQAFTQITGSFDEVTFSDNANIVSDEDVINTTTATNYILGGVYKPEQLSDIESDKNSTIGNTIYSVKDIVITGDYIVEVVAGNIIVNKTLSNMETYDFDNGNPTFTFELIKDGAVYGYKSVSFNKGNVRNGDSLSVTFDNLPKGTYTVKELDAKGFTVTNDNSSVSFQQCSENDHTVPETKVFKFTNTYIPSDEDTHNDIIVNSFEVDENGNITIIPSLLENGN